MQKVPKSVLRPDFKKDDNLVTVVVQDSETKRVLMVAYTDEAGYTETLETGEGVFWLRSRQQRWKKGETSGHTLKVHQVLIDCDYDALIYLITPNGPTCHSEAQSYFYRYAVLSAPVEPAPKEKPEDMPALLKMNIHPRIFATCKCQKALTIWPFNLLGGE